MSTVQPLPCERVAPRPPDVRVPGRGSRPRCVAFWYLLVFVLAFSISWPRTGDDLVLTEHAVTRTHPGHVTLVAPRRRPNHCGCCLCLSLGAYGRNSGGGEPGPSASLTPAAAPVVRRRNDQGVELFGDRLANVGGHFGQVSDRLGSVVASLFVMIGLPGAGKTARARQLAVEHGALRLSPDEWLVPLFGGSDPVRERDIVEGRFIWVARQLLRSGQSVILDFGVWSRSERDALRAVADECGANCHLVYLEVDDAEQRRRIAARWMHAPESTYPVTDAELAGWRADFDVPDADELSGRSPGEPPEGYSSWSAWTAWRWPTAGE